MHPTHVKGLQSELRVKKFFEELGFAVVHSPLRGADLTCTKGPQTFTVEVKSAMKLTKRRKNGSREASGWAINRIGSARQKDDMIAIVFPERVVVQLMDFFLQGTNANGGRQVGRLREDPPGIPREDLPWHDGTVYVF